LKPNFLKINYYNCLILNILYLCKKFNIMLSSLLVPVSDNEIGVEKRMFFDQSYKSVDNFPDLSRATIAFIGKTLDISKNVRKSMENFRNHFKNIQIVDLGNVINDEDHLDTILLTLNKENIIPILVGFDASVANKYASENKHNIHFVCNNLPYIESSYTHNKNYIGYQRHIVSLEAINEVDQHTLNSLSLGRLRSNINNIEPNIRDTETLYLNLNVVRASDTPSTIGSLPAGLTAEELCQIMKYVGTSNKLSSVFLDANIKDNDAHQASNVLALAFWYLLEGLQMKINDHPTESNDFSGYIINGSTIQDIEFIRHNISQKWWIMLTDAHGQKHYLPCSNDEYTQTIADEIPDRVLKFLNNC